MPAIIIRGGNRLSGSVRVQGAKNGVLPLLAATILCDGECVIHNCPNITDVDVSIQILRGLGCKCVYDGFTLIVDSSGMNSCEIPDDLMRQMRSSIVFMGAIAGKMGQARISSPGGCELGPRPIDIHLSALTELGAGITEQSGYIECNCKNKLKGKCIYLSFPSVGATENLILAAVLADGTTVIHNCAKEPEIVDLARFLNKAGGRVFGAGCDTIRIEGVKKLHATEYSVLPDRIVASTYMSAAAVTGGDIQLENVNCADMLSVLNVFRLLGCRITIGNDNIRIVAPKRLKPVSTVRSYVYPGFPTDSGPFAVAAMSVADGTSVFVENIFENRFRYVDELARFGTNIKTEGKVAVIRGVKSINGASVQCTDLRGGAAVAIAALAAEGDSLITKIHHIDRGYEDFENNLALLGADVRRIE